jgi:hypothetical protein
MRFKEVIIYKQLEGEVQPIDFTLMIILISVFGSILGLSLAIFLMHRFKSRKKKGLEQKAILSHCPLCHSKINPGEKVCSYCGNGLYE